MEENSIPFHLYPKVELHRHLEGSLRLSTLMEIARQYQLNLPGSVELQQLVQIGPDDPQTVANFLSKFATLRQFYRSPEIISRVTYEAVEDAVRDRVRYMELRFTPVALSRANDYALEDVMDWVVAAIRQATQDYNIQVNLLASVNRHEPVAVAEQVVDLAVAKQAQGIVGIDLAGDEVNYPAAPFRKLFHSARQSGLSVSVHAGEWAGAENIADAIEHMGADRIGHGVRVMEAAQVVSLARETGIAFETCITSNYQSGVVDTISKHPLKKMLEAGLVVTINTDDPGISKITLTDEYRRAHDQLGLTVPQIKQTILDAAGAAFLDRIAKDNLVQSLSEEIDLLVTQT